MLLPRHQNASQSRDIKYQTDHQNFVQEEIKRRLNSGIASYHSFKNPLFFTLLSRNVKIRIYKTLILLCETWSLTLREEHRLRVFENRVLWKIFAPRRDEIKGVCEENCLQGAS
jgi:hypothetical protein